MEVGKLISGRFVIILLVIVSAFSTDGFLYHVVHLDRRVDGLFHVVLSDASVPVELCCQQAVHEVDVLCQLWSLLFHCRFVLVWSRPVKWREVYLFRLVVGLLFVQTIVVILRTLFLARLVDDSVLYAGVNQRTTSAVAGHTLRVECIVNFCAAQSA